MIIDITTGVGFYKCCTCGYVGCQFEECKCRNKVMAYYDECPKCKSNGVPISYCRFCTNCGYGDPTFLYKNGYLSK